LTATSGFTNPTFKWYDSQTSTTVLSIGASYTTPVDVVYDVLTITYYVSVSDDNHCENVSGDRKEVTIIVNPYATDANITANGTTICSGSTTALSASVTGVTNPIYKWYSSQTETTELYIGAIYTTPNLNTSTTYYVSVSGDEYCENETGSRKAVTVTVLNYATDNMINVTGTATICSGTNTILTASATGVTNPVYKWYSSQTETTELYIGAIYTTPNLNTNTTYYVSVSGDEYCENETGNRKAVTVTVLNYATDNMINLTGTATICSGTNIILTASATGVTNPVYRWYPSQTETTELYTGAIYTTPNLNTSTTYYVSVSGDEYCENEMGNRKAVTVTVNPYATADDITANGTTICFGLATTLTASASGVTNPTFKWYDSQTSTSELSIGASYDTPELTLTTKYYVSVYGDN
jgi:hypothetical protein